jgi:hypothetical protein
MAATCAAVGGAGYYLGKLSSRPTESIELRKRTEGKEKQG